jgi:hypothetical protein
MVKQPQTLVLSHPRQDLCDFQRARGAPETLSNGEHSLEFTNYEQTTNPFWSPP